MSTTSSTTIRNKHAPEVDADSVFELFRREGNQCRPTGADTARRAPASSNVRSESPATDSSWQRLTTTIRTAMTRQTMEAGILGVRGDGDTQALEVGHQREQEDDRNGGEWRRLVTFFRLEVCRSQSVNLTIRKLDAAKGRQRRVAIATTNEVEEARSITSRTSR